MKRLGDCLGGDSMGFSVRYGRGVSEAWKYPRIYAGHRVAKDGRPESDQDTPGGDGAGQARRGIIEAPMSAVRVSVLADHFLQH